jgi:hypothetical protein
MQSVNNKGQITTRESTGNRKAFEKQLENTSKEEEKISNKIDILNDSIFSLDNQILAVQSKAETSGELGPLKYISKLIDVSMDRIINWLLLIIIFVFDPLAISLVIAANFAFNQLKDHKKLAIYDEKPAEESTPIIEKPKVEEPQPPKTFYSFVPPIFSRKKDGDDIKTY